MQIVYANNFITRMVGLLGRVRIPADYVLVIAPCKSIHTWFMFCAIDVVFVDHAGRVIRVEEDVRPWRICGEAAAVMVVETAAYNARALGFSDGVFIDAVIRTVHS